MADAYDELISSSTSPSAFDATLQVESGNRQFDKQGNTLKSSAGAVGAAQVMPSTGPEAAKIAGVEWDPYRFELDADYNKQLGEAYLKQQQSTFNDDEKAHAAYNAGPGAVQKAVKKGGSSWKDYLPQETKDYLKKIMGVKQSTPTSKPQAKAVPADPYEALLAESQPADPYDQLIAKEKPPAMVYPTSDSSKSKPGTLATFGAHALESLPSAATTMGGWALAGAALDVVAPEVGIPLEIAVKLGTSLLTGYAGEKATQAVLPESAKQYLARSEKEHPYAALGGDIASFIPVGGVGMPETMTKALGLAGVGTGIEAIREGVTGEELDPYKMLISGVTMPFVGTKNIFEKRAKVSPLKDKIKTDPKVEETLGKQYEMFTEEELKQHPSSLGAKDIIDPHAGKEPTIAVADTIDQIKADSYLADMHEHDIKTEVPDLRTRERMTMAVEGDKPYDKILTDKQMHEQLHGDSADTIKEKIARGEEPNIGLIKASEKMRARLESNKFRDAAERESYQTRYEKLNKAIEYLKGLPSEEHAISVLDRITSRIKTIGEEALSRGMIEGLRNNYITHILDWSKSALNKDQLKSLTDSLFSVPKESRLNRDFTANRIYGTIRELEAAIKTWSETANVPNHGIVVKKDIAEIASAYEKSMLTAIQHDKLKTHFLNTKNANGLPWMTRNLEQGLANKYQPFTGVGSKPLEGILVHPDLVDAMKFLFRQNDPNMFQRGLGGISYLTKSFNTTMSFFHAWNLGIAGATLDPAKAVKELFTGGAGIRMATKNFAAGVDREMTANWIKSGLIAGTEDVQRSIVADSGVWVDKMLGQMVDKDLKITQYATDPFDKYVLQTMNKVTWDYMHTGQKLSIANHLFGKIKARNPNIPDMEIMKEVSATVNKTLGGLNWLREAESVHNKFAKAFAMKAANIQGREWAQVLLFAPDWTVSTLRAVTNALPKELSKPHNWELRKGVEGFFNPKTQNDLARRYVFNTMVSWAIILNGMNMAFSKHPIWDNKDPTRVDLGDGTSIQPAKHSMEAAEWLRDPNKTLGNKLGFWPKALVTMTTGMAYPSPTAPKVKDNTTLGRLAHVGESALPFQVGSAISAPEGEKLKRAGMSALGIPIYGQTKSRFTSPEVRRERHLRRLKTRLENLKKRREERQQ